MAIDNAKNFAKVTLSTGYTSAATSVVLSAGNGALLPTVSFNAVWWDSTLATDPADDPNAEVVRVTNISTDTLTITRAQEGTSATNKNTAGHIYKMIAGLTAKVINTDMAAVTNLTQNGTGVIVTGNISALGVTPNTALDAGTGAVSMRVNPIVLVNGLNSNINIGSAGFIRTTGPSAGFSLGGFTGGTDGRILYVRNFIGQNCTIVNQDASSSAGNKIQTPTNANVVLTVTNTTTAWFIYDATNTYWVLMGTGS